jgi:hypothetical protein
MQTPGVCLVAQAKIWSFILARAAVEDSRGLGGHTISYITH